MKKRIIEIAVKIFVKYLAVLNYIVIFANTSRKT